MYIMLGGSDAPSMNAVGVSFTYIFYTVTGILSLIVLFIPFYRAFTMKVKLLHPQGIILNILSLQYIQIMRQTFAGIVFIVLLAGGLNANHIWDKYYSYSYWLINDNCKVEATASTIFFEGELIWILIWMFDTYRYIQKPLHDTSKNLFLYATITYTLMTCTLIFLIIFILDYYHIDAKEIVYICIYSIFRL